MKFRSLLIPSVLSCAAWGQAAKPAAAPAAVPTKIAIIQFQQAVLATAEGRQVSAAMRAKYDPKKVDVEKRRAQLQSMQDQLQKGGATMTAAARTKLQNALTAGERALNRDIEDLNTEVQADQGKAMQSMASQMGEIIKKYATEHGYAVVLDASGQATPILWAASNVNITADIVKLYDQAHPAKAVAPAAGPAPAKK